FDRTVRRGDRAVPRDRGTVMAPAEGSKRYDRMILVKGVLSRAGRRGLRYDELAEYTGLSAAAVTRACDDLRYETDGIVGIPAPHNGYRASWGWHRAAKQGEGNQLRHAATRFERMAVRFDNEAA